MSCSWHSETFFQNCQSNVLMLCERVKTKVGASAARDCNIGERESRREGRDVALAWALDAWRARPACLA